MRRTASAARERRPARSARRAGSRPARAGPAGAMRVAPCGSLSAGSELTAARGRARPRRRRPRCASPAIVSAATGSCSVTSIRRPCGKLGIAWTARTTGNDATAARSAAVCTSSVLMWLRGAAQGRFDRLRLRAVHAAHPHVLDRHERGLPQPQPAAGEQWAARRALPASATRRRRWRAIAWNEPRAQAGAPLRTGATGCPGSGRSAERAATRAFHSTRSSTSGEQTPTRESARRRASAPRARAPRRSARARAGGPRPSPRSRPRSWPSRCSR